MKRASILFILALSLGMFVTSCGESKKEAATEGEHKEAVHDHKEGEAKEAEGSEEMAMAVYACPMKCEGEKTYSEAGSCPTCKMDLKEVKPHEHKEGEKAEHAEGEHSEEESDHDEH